MIVLAAGSVHNFSDAQLKKLFRDNHVILDGRAVMLLIERGLGGLINAAACRRHTAHFDVQSYEQIEGDVRVNGIRGYRATAFKRTGDYVSIVYDKLPQVKSRVYDFRGNEMGYGMAVVGKHLVIPYVADEFYPDQLHPLRGKILCDYVDSLKKKFVRTCCSNVYAYYSRAEQNVLIMVNTTNDTLPYTGFKMTGEEVIEIEEIERDGKTRKKEFVFAADGFTVIKEPFPRMTTKTFLIKVQD